jgi:uncharacterized membrane protein
MNLAGLREPVGQTLLFELFERLPLTLNQQQQHRQHRQQQQQQQCHVNG